MKWLLWFIFIVINGCAQLPPAPTAETKAIWEVHQAQANTITTWQIQGRIGVTTVDDRWSASVYWEQNKTDYELRFSAPAGQGAMLLQGNRYGVRMQTADNQVMTASTPEELIIKALEVEIPVTNLYFWIRGIPAPFSQPHYLLNEQGRLHSLEQDGWRIAYTGYVEQTPVALPNKLSLENDTYKVKIVISQWQIGN